MTGKTYFWVAASVVLLQFRLNHESDPILRLNQSAPEAHYIRTVDFDHRKQLVCWVSNFANMSNKALISKNDICISSAAEQSSLPIKLLMEANTKSYNYAILNQLFGFNFYVDFTCSLSYI